MGKSIIEGKIDRVYVKDFGEEDQYGNQYAVNANINGEWYGLGKKKKPVANVKHGNEWHQLAEGDVIEAVVNSVERNGRTYNNIRASDVTVKEVGNGGNSGVSSGSTSAGPTSANNPAPVGGGDRQAAIMRQSAMGYAAQIVAGTLTSKSSLDDAAAEVVRIAADYFMPYAEHGLTPDETRKQEVEQQNQQAAQQADDDEDFDDEVPF
jgi:hypothetical protein